MQPDHQAQPLDLVWGADAIGKAIGRSERQAKHMMANGQIPARKIQGRWVASLTKLRKHFEAEVSTQ
ncbi:hypothetical protein [Devosia sp. Root635]|uniref:hypothetical protein n=1 Tax=Devosia sp. Root635 TaxID=1736575 RepID=UPI0006FFFE6D|nr:hypothetical protein [Devosia sp. Root635]KRA42052.1 hypothetical protein ASD80_10015 [Devosia sp. Root635]